MNIGIISSQLVCFCLHYSWFNGSGIPELAVARLQKEAVHGLSWFLVAKAANGYPGAVTS